MKNLLFFLYFLKRRLELCVFLGVPVLILPPIIPVNNSS